MKEKKHILYYLKEEAADLAIPESVTPKEIKKCLEEREGKQQEKVEEKTYESGRNVDKRKGFIKNFHPKYIIAAACLCLFMGMALVSAWGKNHREVAKNETKNPLEVKEAVKKVEIAENKSLTTMEYPAVSYEDIYASMFGHGEEEQYKYVQWGGYAEGTIIQEAAAADGGMGQAPASSLNRNTIYKESEVFGDVAEGVLEDSAIVEKSEQSNAEHGITNNRTQGVEEADVVKNDGRYLYQKIYQENNNMYSQAIQIVDTAEGLKEVIRIGDFENIQEFYIWEDILVTIENKYLAEVLKESHARETMPVYVDTEQAYHQGQYHEISIFNISDRSLPEKIKTFTLKGFYDSSRIAEGYFYGFSKFYANPGEGESDYEAYIPLADGEQLKPEQIFLPEENKGNCYLLLTSIDLNHPTKFADVTAVVTDSDMYYVSNKNIYLADSMGFSQMQGTQTNRISLLRFAYENGKFCLQAQGEVPGNLESSFSMDEYQGNLRLVTTVNEYRFEEIRDDLTGEVIGNDLTDEKQSNSLYILDTNLKVIGRIENLAEGERIYSARFLGETGYFVTFRQMDPLFAVDLKDPKNPFVLSELKISGFSEYLHFWGENRLLGIGMEAEEETGRTTGMKLSMFDITDPANVEEISKLHLNDYDHSEALYNHRAVMISPDANIFGFEAEGYGNGDYKRDYIVYTYENDRFVEVIKIETKNQYGEIYSNRGTFIGNVFYLLTGDGSVRSYDLHTGRLCDSL